MRVSRSGKLTTFGGVFTPSILTILGLILFLRIGFVVGNGGVLGAFAILAIANAVSVLTSLSLSAIATTRRVRGGGVYFLISRSLGVSYGGATGLVLFAAQAISVGFYCVGFAEGVLSPHMKSLYLAPDRILEPGWAVVRPDRRRRGASTCSPWSSALRRARR